VLRVEEGSGDFSEKRINRFMFSMNTDVSVGKQLLFLFHSLRLIYCDWSSVHG
jgi:hypothetical protein